MKQILLIAFAAFLTQSVFGQVGIGTLSPDNSAVLELSATDKGFLVPRVNQTDMGLIPAPADGLVVYNITEGRLFFYNQFIGWGPVEGFNNFDPDRIVDATDGDTKVAAIDTGAFDYVLINIEGQDKVKWLKNASDHVRQQIESQHVFIGNGAGAVNSTGNFNTFVGGQAGQSNTEGTANTFIGNYAGQNNTEGERNTFIGEDAGSGNSLGNANTAVGEDALGSNTTGHGNVAIGRDALTSNDNLSYLVAIGDSALYNNKSGDELIYGTRNTAVGSKALFANTEGYWNTAIGQEALIGNTLGSENTAVGLKALSSSIEGDGNVALGSHAASNLVTGSSNVAIGAGANQNANNGGQNVIIGFEAGKGSILHTKAGNIFIGYQAGKDIVDNNKLIIENSDSNTPLIYGDFDQDYVRINDRLGIGTFNPDASLHIKHNQTNPGLNSEVNYVGTSDVIAVKGYSNPADGYGLGGFFEGGYRGVQAKADGGSASFTITGMYTEAQGSGTVQGIYATATGGTTNWAGYFGGGNVHVQNELRVGTTTGKSGYAVTVDGKIVGEELKIEDSGNWPDYVFADDYHLMPLELVEKSILQNKHLPGIPSAAEVAENGIMVGDMQKKMMEKIEELTLHLIALQKRIIELETK